MSEPKYPHITINLSEYDDFLKDAFVKKVSRALETANATKQDIIDFECKAYKANSRRLPEIVSQWITLVE